jgi:iron(III) transport system substrate-binding protein
VSPSSTATTSPACCARAPPTTRRRWRRSGIVWPNQQSWGTHVNVSGAGVLKTSPNKANAIRFLEYLASDQAQVYFADGNNEWPVVTTVKVQNPALDAMGPWKADAMPIEKWSPLTAEAQKVFDRAGWR